MKRCCTCHQEKDESEFSKDKTTKDGLYKRCKACHRDYWRNGVRTRKPLEDRFWSYVDKTGEHWLWRGALTKSSDGRSRKWYGIFSINNKTRGAHRTAYEITYGPIPAGMCVLHRCDTPLCVNPDHLFLGTIQDNNADRQAKNRTHRNLTKEQACDIVARYDGGEKVACLAEEHGVNISVIYRILSGESYSSLTGRMPLKRIK